MIDNQIVSLVQLALKAGKAVSGDRLLPAVTSGKASLVVYNADMGKNMLKKIQDKSRTAGIEAVALDPEVFDRITQRPYKAFAITEKKFSRAILEKVKGQVI